MVKRTRVRAAESCLCMASSSTSSLSFPALALLPLPLFAYMVAPHFSSVTLARSEFTLSTSLWSIIVLYPVVASPSFSSPAANLSVFPTFSFGICTEEELAGFLRPPYAEQSARDCCRCPM